jgi:hypothetical protein
VTSRALRPDRSRWRAAVLAAAAALTASACATPEGDPSLYRDEAVSTTKAAHSSVATVAIVLRTRLRDLTFGRAADDAVSTAETSLTSTAGTFEGLQPPRGADSVRRQATQLLSDAEDAVAAARIAVRRDDRAGMRAALVAVIRSADALDKAPETLP